MLKRVWHFLNMPCEEVTRLVSAGYDRDLTRMERWAVRSHLVYCRACHRFKKQWDLIRSTLAEAGRSEDPPAGVSLSTAARDRIRNAMEQE